MDLFKSIHSILLNDLVYLGPSGYEVGFVSSVHSNKDLLLATQKMKAAMDKVLGS